MVLQRSKATAAVPLTVEVLPFVLMRPSKQYSLTRVPRSASACCDPLEADPNRLKAIRELGIGSLCLDAPPPDHEALEHVMTSAGLCGPVLAPPDASAAAPSPPAAGAGMPVQRRAIRWYALLQQAPSSADAVAAVRAGGAMIACRLDGDAPPAAPGVVDLPIYDAGSSYCARLAGRAGPLAASTLGWWRWEVDHATPIENRLRCGALLWQSGLSGALLEIGPDGAADPAWPLRWEAVRQGLLDSRYLTTLFALSRQVKDMDRRNPLPGQAEEAVAAALNGLTRRPSAAAAQRFREVVIDWILRLHGVVGS
jgi:hypothetical protein